MSLSDWIHLLLFHFSLSLLAVGGAITLAPDLHRWLVNQQGWLTEPQFNQSIALAQAAPGPNVLFVAMTGWTVGLNAAGPEAAPWLAYLIAGTACLLSLAGVLAPSSVLTLIVTRWCRKNRGLLIVQVLRQGLAPIVVGMLWATSWLLGRSGGHWLEDSKLWLLTLVSAALVCRTRIPVPCLLAFGALLGAMGWV
ncbi:MAG: hypothetical protein RLZZ555_977 [Pseudomonadota bacterium]|jgi:chromate transporter